MKKKAKYEEAKIEILIFEGADIITASGGYDGPMGGTDSSEDSGWTPRKNYGDW